MPRSASLLTLLGLATVAAAVLSFTRPAVHGASATPTTPVQLHLAVAHDLSPPLATLRASAAPAAVVDCGQPECGEAPAIQDAPQNPAQRVGAEAPASGTIHPAVESVATRGETFRGPGSGLGTATPAVQPARGRGAGSATRAGATGRLRRLPTEATAPPPPPPVPPPFPEVSAAGTAVEQTAMGTRAPATLVTSFDGLGYGFVGVPPPPAGAPAGRGGRGDAMDLSLAVGPDQIVQIINSRLAVFTKRGKKYHATGTVLYGDVPTNTIFNGFGGRCGASNNGDAVVRYDQLAGRWLIVMPIFSRPPAQPEGPYGMCYAVSATSDALGAYYRYEFQRPLFPDYPRPAVWPDGYYVPTSSGDGVIQKQDCIADRARMLKGQPATEQCVLIDGVSFLNNADVDGKKLPPAGAPNIMMAAGGTQLKKIYDGDSIYWFKVHVDWKNFRNTSITPSRQIAVAPYHFLCDGQLSNCVTQPDPDHFLDSQGDKLMQRLVYRNHGGHESILAEHSVDTAAHSGGVRWYEFRLDAQRDPVLYQQGTYAPDSHYRWMASMDMDKFGNIGIGYSYGGAPAFPGQRFAARLANDPLGVLSLKETVLAEGQASQARERWEDYATTAMDPSDDCTFWYVGDYLKAGATNSTTKIGAFRLPRCSGE